MSVTTFPPKIPLREYFSSQKAFITHMIDAFSTYQGRYGDIFKARLVARPMYVVSAPEYAAHVLQKSHRNYYKDAASHILGEVIGNGDWCSQVFTRRRSRISPTLW